MLKIISIICLSMFSLNAIAEAYLCTAETSAGLTYDKVTSKWKGWHSEKPNFQVVFKVLLDKDKEKHDEDEREYGFYDALSGQLINSCEYWFSEIGVAHCTDSSANFRFVRESRDVKGVATKKARFIAYNLAPSFYSDQLTAIGGAADNPSITMGGCIKIN